MELRVYYNNNNYITTKFSKSRGGLFETLTSLPSRGILLEWVGMLIGRCLTEFLLFNIVESRTVYFNCSIPVILFQKRLFGLNSVVWWCGTK